MDMELNYDKEVNDMETPKNTMMRDENGNIREGVKWYVELNDILVRFFGNECGYSRGFQRIVIDGHGYLGDIFELDIDKQPTQEFLDYIKNYHSKYIKGIYYRKEVEQYGRVMYRNVILTIL